EYNDNNFQAMTSNVNDNLWTDTQMIPFIDTAAKLASAQKAFLDGHELFYTNKDTGTQTQYRS
ncbi:MAG: hypothetical protein R6V25_04505, partial [Desulfatiglandales bacterium]